MTNVVSWRTRKVIFNNKNIIARNDIINGFHYGDVIMSRIEEEGFSLNHSSRKRSDLYTLFNRMF